MNIVAVLIYSRENLDRSLSNYLLIHLGITLFAVFLSILFAMYISRFISRPLVQIIEDIEADCQGVIILIRLGKTGGDDIDRLGNSIHIMVGKILSNIDLIHKGHEEVSAEHELEREKNCRTGINNCKQQTEKSLQYYTA